MKVLWFCNTPAAGAGLIDASQKKGGWLQGLDKAIQGEVELHVAFFNPSGPARFRVGRSTYYSIMPSDWKRRLLLKSIASVDSDRDDTELYLQIVDEVGPDVLHIHGTESGFIEILGRVTCPILVSMQGILTYIERKISVGLGAEVLRRTVTSPGFRPASLLPKTYSFEMAGMKRRAAREREGLRKVLNIAGRTDWDRNVARVLAPQARYFKIDRILKDEFYERSWHPPAGTDLRVFTTSSPGPYKGIETIIEASHELRKIVPEAVWTIAGVPKESSVLTAAKKKLKDRFDLSGLRFLGRIDADEIVREMQDCHVYATASHAENSPNNLAEAMMLGLPCVATMAGGTATYLKDRQTGLLVQDGDPWGLAGAVLELWRDRDLALNLGSAARKAAQNRHDRKNIRDQVLSAYRQILDRGVNG